MTAMNELKQPRYAENKLKNIEKDSTCKSGKVYEMLERLMGGWIQRNISGSIEKNGKVQTRAVELIDDNRE